MKKRILMGLALIIVLVSGGVFIYHKLTKPDLGPKTTKLYQHGFRLLEEQIGTYIKEYYAGVEKIEFSPIYVTEEGSTFSNAYVRPTIYDKYGNKATLGTPINNYNPSSFGIVSHVILNFDGDGNEAIDLKESKGNNIDVSKAHHLPDAAKLNRESSTDGNIKSLVDNGQLKEVVKDEKVSPNAEIVYNTEFQKGGAE